VAHSLGAIVSRRAILNARLKRKKWVDKTGLFLFAPAHCGSRSIQQLAADALAGIPGIGKSARAAAEYKLAPLDDLKEGSQTLRQLEDDTKKALATGGAAYLIAKEVVFGMKELLVNTVRFCDDPVADFLPGHDHNSICKPSTKFLAPLHRVARFI
jgi:hypothetical protein